MKYGILKIWLLDRLAQDGIFGSGVQERRWRASLSLQVIMYKYALSIVLRQHEIWKLVRTKHVLGGWLHVHQVNNSALLYCVLVEFSIGLKILRINHSITFWSHFCTFQPSSKRSLMVGRNFSHVMVTSSQHARLRLRQVRLVTSTT